MCSTLPISEEIDTWLGCQEIIVNPSYHNSAGISKIFSEITNIMSLLTQLTKLLNMYINLFLEKIIMEYSIMKQVFFFFFVFKTTDAETLIRCSSLLVGVLGCYCSVSVITEEEAYTSELFQKAKVWKFILVKLWRNLSEMYAWGNWYIGLKKQNF